MIRSCNYSDFDSIYHIINEAAHAYQGKIPADCWHEPYMDRAALLREMDAGVRFSGWEEEGVLAGIMGIQNVLDATLIRHAYVHSMYQGKGIGGRLLDHLIENPDNNLMVGTWAAAVWAIRLYERHGFHLVNEVEKDKLLRKYWKISDRQRETSVVLKRIP
jgi:GNAT superfamily N-acetyltransferase